MSTRIPKYRCHKGSGQAIVQINGKRIYLGKHGSAKSKERYRQLIAEFLSKGRVATDSEASSSPTINELILAYFKFAKTYYVKNGRPTDELGGIRAVMKVLRRMYGHSVATEFGPKAFKLVRDSLIREGLSRKYINDSMGRIRRMFRWASNEEMVPVTVFQALAAIPGLKKGRSEARETEPILPVSDVDVEAVLPHLPDVVADMVRFQRYTGCRPQEVCFVRPVDIDRSSDIWVYRPENHKNEHRERSRVIFIGPRAQVVLTPYLDRAEAAYCFSPRESEAARRPSNSGKLVRFRDCYDRHSYRRAVHRACKRAAVNVWTPNQLRHSAATELRKQFGLEAAQIVLGHSRADVTQIYAERDEERARQAMRHLG